MRWVSLFYFFIALPSQAISFGFCTLSGTYCYAAGLSTEQLIHVYWGLNPHHCFCRPVYKWKDNIGRWTNSNVSRVGEQQFVKSGWPAVCQEYKVEIFTWFSVSFPFDKLSCHVFIHFSLMSTCLKWCLKLLACYLSPDQVYRISVVPVEGPSDQYLPGSRQAAVHISRVGQADTTFHRAAPGGPGYSVTGRSVHHFGLSNVNLFFFLIFHSETPVITKVINPENRIHLHYPAVCAPFAVQHIQP